VSEFHIMNSSKKPHPLLSQVPPYRSCPLFGLHFVQAQKVLRLGPLPSSPLGQGRENKKYYPQSPCNFFSFCYINSGQFSVHFKEVFYEQPFTPGDRQPDNQEALCLELREQRSRAPIASSIAVGVHFLC